MTTRTTSSSLGRSITYTLRLTGTTGRPTAHDLWVVDCVPNGLAFGNFVDPHPGHGDDDRR